MSNSDRDLSSTVDSADAPQTLRGHLAETVAALSAGQLKLLISMAKAMTQPPGFEPGDGGDFMAPALVDYFGSRLQIHHAFTAEKFNKKSFEYALVGAARAAGRSAEVLTSGTNPGEDIRIDGKKYSLKTQADRGISPAYLHISKFMEVNGIRAYQSSVEDCAREVRQRMLAHLAHYERILMLRAFAVAPARLRYDLVEIPHRVLAAIDGLTPADFTPGRTWAAVRIGGQPAYRVAIDMSDEKITLRQLSAALCTRHGSWTIQILEGAS